MVGQARTGRNQTAHDHVFLQAAQIVFLTHNGGFSQNARRFLEGSGGNEGVGGQRSLRDAEQDVVVLRRRLAFGDNAVVFVEHFAAFNLFARDEVRVARIRDLHAAQHLTDNHFDVLVVDLHALQTVDVLHFVDDVARKLLNAEQTQNVVRIGRTFHDFFTALHDLTVVHEDLLVLADQELVFNTVVVGDDEALLTLGFLAERNRTGFFGEHAGVLGASGFKEFGHSRQTARNITGLLTFTRDTCEHFALMNRLAVAHHDNGAHRQLNRHSVIGPRNLHLVALFVQEVNERTHDVGGRGLGL